MDEVVDVAEDITNNNDKKARLPSMSKLTNNMKFEGVRCDALESALSSGAVCEHSEVKDAPTNPWCELLNGWWNKRSGALKGCEPPKGCKRLCCDKQKVTSFSSALSDKHDEDIKEKTNPLPSCVATKSTCGKLESTLKERETELKEEDETKKNAN